jgi:hypothetical protein
MFAENPKRTSFVRARNARNESTVVDELALRPGFDLKPDCHWRRNVRHEAGGVGQWF